MGAVTEISNTNNIVLYDGVCKFCNGSVNFILRHEKDNKLTFSPLQSILSKKLSKTYGFDTKELNTIILIENEKVYFKSKAIFLICAHLKFPWSLLQIFKILPSSFSNLFYDLVSKNRYSVFGKSDSCILPSPDMRARFLDS